MKKFLFLIMVLVCSSGFACRCHETELKKELKYTSAIVHVKVLKIDYVSKLSILADKEREYLEEKYESKPQVLNPLKNKNILKVEAEIVKSYKGSFNSERLIVYTSRHGQSCGYLGFKLGKDFIVFLNQEVLSKRFFGGNKNGSNPNRLWTNRCSRTTVFDETDLTEIKEGLNDLEG